MPTRLLRPQAVAVLCLLAGCAGSPHPACHPARASQPATFDQEHAARVAVEEEPAQARSPGEKGPSPEGLEALAMVEMQMLDARAADCAPTQ
jgi:hypothetical protein